MNGLKLVVTVLLVALNAFFVIAEYALVRSRRARLEVLREENARGAELALEQLGNVNEYISAVQIGVTVCLDRHRCARRPRAGLVARRAFPSSVSKGPAVTISVVLAFLVITTVQLIAGEMVPKFYAIDRAESVARRVARPLQTFSVAIPSLRLRPHRRGRPAPAAARHRHAPTDRRGLPGGAEAADRRVARRRSIDPGEAGMLRGVFHLHEQEARQVMTPIPTVVTIDISQDVETALQPRLQRPHRLVVTEDEDRDRVRGIVHVSELARLLMQEGPHASLEPIVHEALIVPETKPLDDLLADLQRERASMAVVVDEYGRVVGVVSVEDIVEEIVGEITDETDPAPARSVGWPTATGSSAATWRSPTSPITGSSCPSTATPTTPWAGSCSPSWAACPGAGTPSTPTATRSAWSRCARTAWRPSASASVAPPAREADDED